MTLLPLNKIRQSGQRIAASRPQGNNRAPQAALRWRQYDHRRQRGKSVRPAAPQDLVAVFAHPVRARQMAAMDLARPFRLSLRVDAEEHFDSLFPACPVGLGIEQMDIELDV